MQVWLVVPVFNERDALLGVLAQLKRLDVTSVVVDDGSTDGSYEVALSKADWVIRYAANLGQGAALQTGMDFALSHGADVIVTFDADGQHDPGDISKLLEALEVTGADFALGSRFLGDAPGIPRSRRLVLQAGIVFTRLFSGLKITDTHNGLRAMASHGAKQIRLTMNRMEHASEILDQIGASGLRYTEVPVRIKYSEETLAKGQSSFNALKMALKLLIERMR